MCLLSYPCSQVGLVLKKNEQTYEIITNFDKLIVLIEMPTRSWGVSWQP